MTVIHMKCELLVGAKTLFSHTHAPEADALLRCSAAPSKARLLASPTNGMQLPLYRSPRPDRIKRAHLSSAQPMYGICRLPSLQKHVHELEARAPRSRPGPLLCPPQEEWNATVGWALLLMLLLLLRPDASRVERKMEIDRHRRSDLCFTVLEHSGSDVEQPRGS